MTPILHRLILSTLPLLLWLTSFAQDKPLSFHTSKGLTVKVDTRGIYINNKKVHWFDTDELIPDSRRNKLIEDGGTAFLFLEMSDAPNLNKLYGFRISANRADSVVYTNTSDIVDMDGDGYLEFGGADLTEVYSSEDSMYYIPTEYYEIRNGRIHFDTTLTRDRDIWINGIYLAHPADANGNCCIVIPKPGKKHVDSVPLMHPPIRSERVDGPANIRQTAHGRVLYTLYDDTPIYTSDSSGKWCAVAVLVGITKKEDDSFELREGTRLFWKGREIGKTLTRVPIDPIDIAGEGSNTYAILRGYTSLQNIKPQTMPEYVLHRLVQPGIPTTAYLHDFLQGFQFIQTTTFTTTTSGGYKTYQLDEACEPNHKGALRLLLAFDHDKLFAIVHHRALGPMPNKPSVLNRGYQLTIIGDQPATQVSDFTDKINHFINMAD